MQAVRRRLVLYIPGYDPVPPRRYRELYRRQSAKQAAISGFEMALRPKLGSGRFGWHVEAVIDGQTVRTDFEILPWSDLVRSSMAQGIVATYRQLLSTVWIYVASGTFWRLARLRKGPVLAALYPIVMLMLQLALALVLGAGVAAGFWGLVSPWLAPLGGLAVGLVLLLFRREDGRIFAYYLMHDFAFSAQAKGAYPAALEARLAVFARAVAEGLQRDVDEVLVVGHSSGAYLAVSVLADVLRASPLSPDGPALNFLSLGQVVPMVSFLPNAVRLRGDLQYLAGCDQLSWVDVTALGDVCAFALCDPVAVTGVSPVPQYWPIVFSAAFSQTLAPARWRRIRWRFLRVHFQYMCAFDSPNDYDYFQITAGPLTLRQRYGSRASSPSRLTKAVSKYTAVTP
ncbi:MAG TPA: hypothetical protein DEA75_13090 [Rhodobacteraceae bacterium]|nr:hypothetical protein [Paracoccaceae bacterium]